MRQQLDQRVAPRERLDRHRLCGVIGRQHVNPAQRDGASVGASRCQQHALLLAVVRDCAGARHVDRQRCDGIRPQAQSGIARKRHDTAVVLAHEQTVVRQQRKASLNEARGDRRFAVAGLAEKRHGAGRCRDGPGVQRELAAQRQRERKHLIEKQVPDRVGRRVGPAEHPNVPAVLLMHCRDTQGRAVLRARHPDPPVVEPRVEEPGVNRDLRRCIERSQNDVRPVGAGGRQLDERQLAVDEKIAEGVDAHVAE